LNGADGDDVILETDRLILRRLRADDLDDLARIYADPDVRRHFPEGTLTRDETWDELQWFLAPDPARPRIGLWATIHKPSGKFIGRCGLLHWTIDGRDEIEVAYLLARRYWRQGLGAECAAALVRYGFDELGLSRLISLIDPANVASQRTAERAGMRFERDAIVDNLPCRIYAIANPAAVAPTA